ncbi:MAG: YncE family protein [Polyangiales bacterium]
MRRLACVILLFGCSKPPVTPTHDASSISLPGSGPAFTDYIAYEPGKERIWIPVAREAGTVEVFDIAKRTFTTLDGFPTIEAENKGKKRRLGPSSVTIAGDIVYVGNRANNQVCAVESDALRKGACYDVPKGIDGIAWVESQKELWITAPHDKTMVVLDASTPGKLAPKLMIELDGEPEGYSVDESRGIFYTNLEDKDATLAIDVKTHKVTSTWKSGCGADGPRGLAIDPVHQLLVVACTDRLRVLREGAMVAELLSGAGVDNVDLLPSKRLVFAAAGKAGRLIVARLEDDGKLTPVASHKTAERVRNAVADSAGNAYAVDPVAGRLVVVPAR